MKHLIAIYAEVCGTPTLKFKALKAKTKRAAEIYMRAEQETQAPLLIATRDELLAIVQKTIGGKAAAVPDRRWIQHRTCVRVYSGRVAPK